MLIIVIFVYILCWFFNYVLYLLIFFFFGFYYGLIIYIIIVLLIFFNVVVDLFLYIWYMDGFKRGIWNMFCCYRNRVCVVDNFGKKVNEIFCRIGFLGIIEVNKE